jgi:hypothetical protein
VERRWRSRTATTRGSTAARRVACAVARGPLRPATDCRSSGRHRTVTRRACATSP